MGHPDRGRRFAIGPPCVDPGELVLSAVLTPADGSLAVVYQDCVRPTPAHEGLLVPTVLPFSFLTRKSSADRRGPLVEHAPTFSLLRGQLLKIRKGAAIQFACCVRHAGRVSEWPNVHSGDTSRGASCRSLCLLSRRRIGCRIREHLQRLLPSQFLAGNRDWVLARQASEAHVVPRMLQRRDEAAAGEVTEAVRIDEVRDLGDRLLIRDEL